MWDSVISSNYFCLTQDKDRLIQHFFAHYVNSQLIQVSNYSFIRLSSYLLSGYQDTEYILKKTPPTISKQQKFLLLRVRVGTEKQKENFCSHTWPAIFILREILSLRKGYISVAVSTVGCTDLMLFQPEKVMYLFCPAHNLHVLEQEVLQNPGRL